MVKPGKKLPAGTMDLLEPLARSKCGYSFVLVVGDIFRKFY